MKKIALILLLCSTNLFAQNLSTSFPAGKGANYKVLMKKDPQPIQLAIYIAGTRVDSVHVEYYMTTKGIIPLQMWQQFEIGVGKGPAEIRKGYVLTNEMKTPETIPSDYLKGAAGGIQVNDFLFKDKASIEKYKVGEEIVEIAAGSTKATHYRTSSNGQTVDYWVSDDAKPLGLVLLTSKSDKNENQNYSIELTSVADNVKPKILPENAVPLTDKGKAYLAKPASMR